MTSDTNKAQTNGISSEYWKGAARGILVLQHCTNCGNIQHYPKVLCGNCQSCSLERLESSGTGNIHSWTITYHPFDKALVNTVPYTLLTVDMAEGVRVLGRYDHSAVPQVGDPVHLQFIKNSQSEPIPTFNPLDE